MNGPRAAIALQLARLSLPLGLLAVLAGCNPFAEPTVAERAPEQWALVDAMVAPWARDRPHLIVVLGSAPTPGQYYG